jgi:uncharacterized membrane protein YphA (DoxX/SURF4 family)
MAKGQSSPSAVRGGSALLAILFLLLGGLKLVGPRFGLDVSEQFSGYPSWVCPLLGGIEIVAALILLVPRTAWVGAIVLLVVTAGYLWTSWQVGQPAQMLLPGLLFLSCGVLTYLRFPKRSVDPS